MQWRMQGMVDIVDIRDEEGKKVEMGEKSFK
jgi:hypothetical protein